LLKKLLDDLNTLGIRDFITEYFQKILLLIGLAGGAIILFILFIGLFSYAFRPRPQPKKDYTQNPYEEKVTARIQILLNDEFVYPGITMMDVSADYTDLAPLKSTRIPDFSTIVTDYDKLEQDTIQKTYQFDFEKTGRQ
jgi:hypothetical protein